MIRKSIKSRILEYFLKNPTQRLRVREIERKVKVPLPSAIKYAKEMENEGILKTVDVSRMKLYTADRSSKNFLFEKKLYNLRSIHDSGIVEHIVKQCSNPTIMLFGSYFRGEDIESSDIDLYIESQKKISLEQYERKLDRKIQPFFYGNIQKVENKDLANNIINGIILNGFLEVLK